MFLISSTAEMNRAPFDIAEAGAGTHRRLPHGIQRHRVRDVLPRRIHINLVTTSPLATTCYGGFLPPAIGVAAVDHALAMVPGPIWFFAKVGLMIWIYMMLRWTFVRPRVDQLMALEWKFLLL